MHGPEDAAERAGNRLGMNREMGGKLRGLKLEIKID